MNKIYFIILIFCMMNILVAEAPPLSVPSLKEIRQLNEAGKLNDNDKTGYSYLFKAIYNKKIDIVAYILNNSNININLKNKHGLTALDAAIGGNDIEMVKLLLNKKAKLNNVNEYGTSLSFTLKNNNPDMLKLLLENGADINFCNTNKETLLHISSTYGNQDFVKILLEKNADVNLKDSLGNTALHCACMTGHQVVNENIAIVKMLLDSKSDLNEKNNKGYTSLHYACIASKLKLQQFLLKKGADVNLQNNNGDTPLHSTVKIQFNTPKDIQLLLENGADINLKNKQGRTPLDICISPILKKYLIQKGAKRINPLPDILLNEAIMAKDVESALIAINKGADVNNEFELNKSPLILAIQKGDFKLVDLLIKHGADVNQSTYSGFTPLHFAVSYDIEKKHTENKYDIAKLLIDKGSDVNAHCRTLKNTPLHMAVQCDAILTIKLLLENNAVINPLNYFLHTPLDYAKNTETKEFLLKHGAKTAEQLKQKVLKSGSD